MSEHTQGRQGPRLSQIVVAGTLGSPQLFTALLLVCAALMGWSISKAYDVQQSIQRNNTEVRLVQQELMQLEAKLDGMQKDKRGEKP